MSRMSEKDFQERNPEYGGKAGFSPSAPSSTGLGLWEECRRARDNEAQLLMLLHRARAVLSVKHLDGASERGVLEDIGEAIKTIED